MAREHRYVARTIAQRRQVNGDDVQAVVQILTKRARVDGCPQIAIGRRQDPQVDADRPRTADPLELAVLQHPQQFALERVGEFTNLVEEDRSAVSQLEPAFLLCDGASERAALVPEQFAFEQRLREGGAIDCDKRFSRARTVEMNRARRQLLAGPGFAGDENSGVDPRDLGNARMDRVDCLTAPDHLVGQVQIRLQTVRLAFERAEPAHVVDRDRGNSRHRCRQLQMIVCENRPRA